MAIKVGPYCLSCVESDRMVCTDVSDPGFCRLCGAPDSCALVDPYDFWDEDIDAMILARAEHDRGVDAEHFASEDRWSELFGVS